MQGNNVEEILRKKITKVKTNKIGVRRRGERCSVVSVQSKPSMTKQADKSRANINNILARHRQTGLVSVNTASPITGEVISPDSYHEAMNIVTAAQQQFDEMPSDLRAKFDNSPTKFLQFCQDKNNIDEMRSLGLANPEEKSIPFDVNIVSNSVSAAKEPENSSKAQKNSAE